MLRFGYLIIIAIFLASCSGNNPESQVSESVTPEISSDAINQTETKEYDVVCGLLFKVEDFDIWAAEYQKHAQNTIIYLRNTDDPNMIVLFEGNESYEDAKNRIINVMDKAFSEGAGVMSEPVTTYYKIKYYQPQGGKNSNFLAFSFTVDDMTDWETISPERVEQLNNYGLSPLGMGSIFGNPNNLFILLAVENLDEFRDNNNSPREINNLLSVLDFPQNTGLSFWFNP